MISPPAYIYCAASAIASVSHYASSRLSTSINEMHYYTAASAGVSAALLIMTFKKLLQSAKDSRKNILEKTAVAKFSQQFQGFVMFCICLSFASLRYLRIVVDGYIFRKRPMIFSLAARNATAAMFFAWDFSTRTKYRRKNGNEKVQASSRTSEDEENRKEHIISSKYDLRRRTASRIATEQPPRIGKSKDRGRIDDERSIQIISTQDASRNKKLVAAVMGTVGCILLSLAEADTSTSSIFENLLMLSITVSLQILHAMLGQYHPSIMSDALLTWFVSATAAILYGELPVKLDSHSGEFSYSRSFGIGTIFSLFGGTVGFIYCVSIINDDKVSLGKYAQASALSKVIAIPLASIILGERPDIGNITNNTGALLTLAAFMIR